MCWAAVQWQNALREGHGASWVGRKGIVSVKRHGSSFQKVCEEKRRIRRTGQFGTMIHLQKVQANVRCVRGNPVSPETHSRIPAHSSLHKGEGIIIMYNRIICY